VHYEVGDHEVLEQDSEMEPYHLCDASKVNVACEEALSVKEDGFAIVALSGLLSRLLSRLYFLLPVTELLRS
jgi:hypothetical protein